MKILLFCLMAMADTGEETDTGTSEEENSSDTALEDTAVEDTAVEDTGVAEETGDPEETGEAEEEDTAFLIDTSASYTSAAELSGETGGFGCSSLGVGSVALFWVSALLVGFRREE